MTALTDSVVVITGASAGIGRATARQCAQAGAHVVLCARDQARLQALSSELAPHPGQHLTVAGDIGQEATAVRLIAETVAAFGRVDILINNAGIGHHSLLADMPPEDMRRLLDTNLLGLLYLSQSAIAQMKQQGQGHIVNISSIVGQRPLPQMGLYCASKTAVNFVSRTWRLELRGDNIRITTVYPGRTTTEFADRRLGDDQLVAPGANPSAIGRVSPERVAAAILKGIRHNKHDVYVTRSDWLFTHLNRLFPRSTDWLLARIAPRFS